MKLIFYSVSGFLYNPEQQEIYRQKCAFNTSKSDDYRRACSKYAIPLIFLKAGFNIPPEFDVDPFPNLAGKTNHDFLKENAFLSEVEHPRWGILIGLITNRTISAGEELFVNYNYKLDSKFPYDRPWYKDAAKAAGILK